MVSWMKMPVNFIRCICVSDKFTVEIKNIVIALVFLPGIYIVSDMIHAVPVINPAATIAVFYCMAKIFGANTIQHLSYFPVVIVVIDELWRNHPGGLFFLSPQVHFTILDLFKIF